MADSSPLGGVPEFLYLDLKPFGGLAGRGGAVRFFMLRNGIEYNETLYPFDEWTNEIKSECIKEHNPAGHLPVLILAGDSLTEHHATLRMFSKQVGEYGSDLKRDYLVDRTADASNEWRDQWAAGIFDEEAKRKYCANREQLYNRFSKFLKLNGAEGGHVVGDKPSFADDLLFAILWDDGRTYGTELLPQSPALNTFFEEYKKQPTISAWCTAALA